MIKIPAFFLLFCFVCSFPTVASNRAELENAFMDNFRGQTFQTSEYSFYPPSAEEWDDKIHEFTDPHTNEIIRLNNHQDYLDKKAAGMFTELYFCDDTDQNPLLNILLSRPKYSEEGKYLFGCSISWLAPETPQLKTTIKAHFDAYFQILLYCNENGKNLEAFLEEKRRLVG